MRLITSCRTLLLASVAGRPVSSSRESLSVAAEVLGLGLVRWAVVKGEEDLRRRRGLVCLGMVAGRPCSCCVVSVLEFLIL